MFKSITIKATLILLTSAVISAGSAIADEPRTINVPEGDLAVALATLAKQSDIELVYRRDQLEGVRTKGVKGTLSTQDAIRKLLEGTSLRLSTEAKTGAMIIAPAEMQSSSEDTGTAALRVAQAGNAAAPVGESQGDESKKEISEIIVTAQKRDERLRDVPVPVTVVSGNSLLESNQTRILEYFTKIPGLNVTPSVQGQQNLSIRGITTGFANPTVSFTIDDVPFGSSGGRPSGLMVPDIDPGDLARIEVLRGPQGTLYGASSLGGLFKLVTVDPSTEGFGGRVQGGISNVSNGNKMGYTVRGLVNVPLGDMFAIRASAFTRQDPGYIDNVVTGESAVNNATMSGGRISALLKASENFSLKLNAMFQEYKGNGQSEIDLFPGLGDLQQRRVPGSGDFDRKLQSYSLVANAKLGSVDLTAVTGYNISDTFDAFDVTTLLGLPSPYTGMGVVSLTYAKVKRFTQEVRLSIPLGSKAEWLVGGFYSDESNDFDQDSPIVNPATGAFIAFRNLLDNGALNLDEMAGFTAVTYRFTDRFDVQLGGRYSRIRQSSEINRSQRFVPPVANGAVVLTSGVSATPDNVFTYLLTPRFKMSDNMMVYARMASGYRIGGGGTSSPSDRCIQFNFPCQYGPDKTLNYELGAKGALLNGMLSFDASVYYIDWKDIQIQALSIPALTTYNTNGSRGKSQGVELSIEARPVDNLTLSAWGAWSTAELTEDLPVGAGLPLGFTGDRLPLSSRVSGSLSADREFSMTPEVSTSVGASVTYIGDRLGLFANNGVRTTYPDYIKVDLRARFMYRSWTAMLYANNITDKHTVLSGGPGFFPPSSSSIVQPRTIGLGVTRTF